MITKIFGPVDKQLQQVQELIDEQCKIKMGSLGLLAHLDFSPLEMVFRPGLVLLSAGLFAPVERQAIKLAVILQLIFMAFKVHNEIREDRIVSSEVEDPREGHQFPVLVGDYLYGKSFSILCESGLGKYIRPVSESVCRVIEFNMVVLENISRRGTVTRDVYKYVHKATAETFSLCCRLGGDLGGADKFQQDVLGDFGHQTGMAYEIIQTGINIEQAEHWLKGALSCLKTLPGGPARDALSDLIYCLQTGFTDRHYMVV